MKKYVKSVYVESFAIALIVLSILTVIAITVGLFYAKTIPGSFVDKGTQIPSVVYTAIYAVLGILIFYHVLFVFTSACLLVLNQDKRR